MTVYSLPFFMYYQLRSNVSHKVNHLFTFLHTDPTLRAVSIAINESAIFLFLNTSEIFSHFSRNPSFVLCLKEEVFLFVLFFKLALKKKQWLLIIAPSMLTSKASR